MNLKKKKQTKKRLMFTDRLYGKQKRKIVRTLKKNPNLKKKHIFIVRFQDLMTLLSSCEMIGDSKRSDAQPIIRRKRETNKLLRINKTGRRSWQ